MVDFAKALSERTVLLSEAEAARLAPQFTGRCQDLCTLCLNDSAIALSMNMLLESWLTLEEFLVDIRGR